MSQWAAEDAAPPPAPDIVALEPRLAAALDEDLGRGDITTAALAGDDLRARARLVAREEGVVCGLFLAEPILRLAAGRFSEHLPPPEFTPSTADGARVERDAVLGTIAGPLRVMLAAERTLLNFLQRLSGIATLTSRFVEMVAGTGVIILDTRKTTPGWRDLEKYAVRTGGGRNHRFGLYDAVLIKDNHLDGTGLPPAEAVRRARERVPEADFVEVEVRSLDELRRVLPAEPDIVMPDNFALSELREAVKMVRRWRSERGRPRPLVEASGGITLENVREVALTGVDRIAVGAITHSAPALDIALQVVRT